MYKSFIHSKRCKSGDSGQYTHIETIIACACPDSVLSCLLHTPNIHHKEVKEPFKQIPFRSSHLCCVSEKVRLRTVAAIHAYRFFSIEGSNEYTNNVQLMTETILPSSGLKQYLPLGFTSNLTKSHPWGTQADESYSRGRT